MKQLLIFTIAIIITSCGSQKGMKTEENENQTAAQKSINIIVPKASQFVKSPLRNRIRLKLNASISEVWALVGKLERMPEYSLGLKRLDANYNNENVCTGYTCHFYPMTEKGEVLSHSETMLWYVHDKGFVTLADEPNVFGLQQSLGVVMLEEEEEDTILQWDVHFTSENDEIIRMNILGFEKALNIDIAQNLIKIFGGSVLENYTQTY
ncbi:MAG: hypothetical protein R2800_05595 [Flavipsychrobacter sp.]